VLADSVRLLGVPAVLWGGYTDYTSLLVDNRVWTMVGTVALLALGIDLYAAGTLAPASQVGYHLVWASLFAAVMVLGSSGLADVFAVVALAVWIPRPPFGIDTTVVYPLVVLGAAVILAGGWQLHREQGGVPFVATYAVATTAGLSIPAALYVGGAT